MNKHFNALIGAAAIVALTAVTAMAADITGAGSTFVFPVVAKWAAVYKGVSGDGLNYQSIGSGGGIRQITAGTVDFAASDVPMTDAQIAESKVKLVAIPAVMTFNYFTGKVEAFDVEMDNSSSELIDYFIKQSHRR